MLREIERTLKFIRRYVLMNRVYPERISWLSLSGGDWSTHMGTFTESVTMECSPDGEPVRMWWRGLCHEIVAKPQSWYQRRPWWQDHTSLRPGEGVGYVDTQIWRLQVVREGEPGILTLDVVLYRPSLRWRVIKVHTRVEPEPEPEPLESDTLETGTLLADTFEADALEISPGEGEDSA